MARCWLVSPMGPSSTCQRAEEQVQPAQVELRRKPAQALVPAPPGRQQGHAPHLDSGGRCAVRPSTRGGACRQVQMPCMHSRRTLWCPIGACEAGSLSRPALHVAPGWRTPWAALQAGRHMHRRAGRHIDPLKDRLRTLRRANRLAGGQAHQRAGQVGADGHGQQLQGHAAAAHHVRRLVVEKLHLSDGCQDLRTAAPSQGARPERGSSAACSRARHSLPGGLGGQPRGWGRLLRCIGQVLACSSAHLALAGPPSACCPPAAALP